MRLDRELAFEVVAALIIISVSIADMVGFLDTVLRPRLPAITLFSISVVLLSSVLERVGILNRVERRINQIGGIQFLPDATSTTRALSEMATHQNRSLLVIGGKSTSVAYLKRISTKVSTEDVIYQRLLTGDHITHELHQHLLPLVGRPSVQVGWCYSEKYGTFTVSELQTIVVLPSSHPKEFTGLIIPGPESTIHYIQLFHEAFRKSLPISNPDQLRVLCQKCGSGIARSEDTLTVEVRNGASELARVQVAASNLPTE